MTTTETRVTTTQVKKPGVLRYIVATLVVLGIHQVVSVVYNVSSTQVESRLAPAQLGNQGEAANAVSRGLTQFNGNIWITAVTLVVLFLIWRRFVSKWMTYRSATVVTGLLLMFTSTGCIGPVKMEQFAEVKDHETAFVVPLEGGSESQETYNSQQYLQQNLIAAKRVSLPLRKQSTGRWPWQFKYIPTARLITVTRTPEHREWIQASGEKTSQVLVAQSKEGTKFSTGAVVAALVLEENAALFRSNYKNVPLSQILDSTVRGFAQEKLAAHFNQLTVDECQIQKSDIFARTEQEMVDEFIKVGITILYFGNHGGLDYLNPAVQEAIDKEYLQKLEGQIADRKLKAQETRNKTTNIDAVADARAATIRAEAQDALSFTTAIDIAVMNAEARLELAKKVKGQLPDTILPAGGDQSLMLQVK